MNLNRQIELTCNNNINVNELSYDEMLYYTTHNFYLFMKFLNYKYK